MEALFDMILFDRSPFADPQHSADYGPLPHISDGDVIQQKIFYK